MSHQLSECLLSPSDSSQVKGDASQRFHNSVLFGSKLIFWEQSKAVSKTRAFWYGEFDGGCWSRRRKLIHAVRGVRPGCLSPPGRGGPGAFVVNPGVAWV